MTWGTTQPASWHLGNNVYSALSTVILESDEKDAHAQKGAGEHERDLQGPGAVDGLAGAGGGEADRGYVISDIVEDEITSSAGALV